VERVEMPLCCVPDHLAPGELIPISWPPSSPSGSFVLPRVQERSHKMTFLLSYLAFQIKSDLANPAKVLISRSEG